MIIIDSQLDYSMPLHHDVTLLQLEKKKRLLLHVNRKRQLCKNKRQFELLCRKGRLLLHENRERQLHKDKNRRLQLYKHRPRLPLSRSLVTLY